MGSGIGAQTAKLIHKIESYRVAPTIGSTSKFEKIKLRKLNRE